MKHSVIAIQVLEEMLDNGFPLVCEIITFLKNIFPRYRSKSEGCFIQGSEAPPNARVCCSVRFCADMLFTLMMSCDFNRQQNQTC